MGPAGQPGEKRTTRAGPVLATGLIRTGSGPSAGKGRRGKRASSRVGLAGLLGAAGLDSFSYFFDFPFSFLFQT